MRGLPPPPPEVVHFDQELLINSSRLTCGFWVFAPGLTTPTPGDMEELLAGWILNVVPVLNTLTANDVVVGACRATFVGASPAQAIEQPPDNHGEVGGDSAPINVAACITWTNNRPGGSHARTLLPCAFQFVDDDNRHLTRSAAAALRVGGLNYLSAVRAIASPAGSNCSPIVLHRSHAGAPLPVAQVDLLLGANPDLMVATVSRRVRSRR